MKTFLNLTLCAVLISSMTSCSEQNSKPVSSQGAAYEIFVVCANDKWESAMGDTLRATMLEPVEMINQKEPQFDLLRIQPQAFEGLVTKHRNILIVKTGEQFTEASMTAQYDVYAKPQLVATISAPTNEALTTYIWEHRSELQQIFEITERNRALDFNAKYGEGSIEKEIQKRFGFEIDIPKGYTIRDNQSDFIWISYELPQASQGVVIYSYPYTGKQNFTMKPLVERRNEFSSRIPGPAEGSYMVTADAVTPELNYVRINGRSWSVMRGFWDVQGDYMGGPFVSYSTLDSESNQVVTMDCYLFSPKHNKRNLLRQLEALIYSVKFPTDPAQTQDTTKME